MHCGPLSTLVRDRHTSRSDRKHSSERKTLRVAIRFSVLNVLLLVRFFCRGHTVYRMTYMSSSECDANEY